MVEEEGGIARAFRGGREEWPETHPTGRREEEGGRKGGIHDEVTDPLIPSHPRSHWRGEAVMILSTIVLTHVLQPYCMNFEYPPPPPPPNFPSTCTTPHLYCPRMVAWKRRKASLISTSTVSWGTGKRREKQSVYMYLHHKAATSSSITFGQTNVLLGSLQLKNGATNHKLIL